MIANFLKFFFQQTLLSTFSMFKLYTPTRLFALGIICNTVWKQKNLFHRKFCNSDIGSTMLIFPLDYAKRKKSKQ